MIISEQEKNRIRTLHRNNSVIKEQEQTMKEKAMACVNEVIGPEKLMNLSTEISEDCWDVIGKMMEDSPIEIGVEDLMGAFACIRDAVTSKEFLNLLVVNWEPMAKCLFPVDPKRSATVGLNAPITFPNDPSND